MTHMTSVLRARQKYIAVFGLNVVERDELVSTDWIIHGAEAKGWNLDISKILVDRAFLVIVLNAFVAEHLDIDVLVDVV